MSRKQYRREAFEKADKNYGKNQLAQGLGSLLGGMLGKHLQGRQEQDLAAKNAQVLGQLNPEFASPEIARALGPQGVADVARGAINDRSSQQRFEAEIGLRRDLEEQKIRADQEAAQSRMQFEETMESRRLKQMKADANRSYGLSLTKLEAEDQERVSRSILAERDFEMQQKRFELQEKEAESRIKEMKASSDRTASAYRAYSPEDLTSIGLSPEAAKTYSGKSMTIDQLNTIRKTNLDEKQVGASLRALEAQITSAEEALKYERLQDTIEAAMRGSKEATEIALKLVESYALEGTPAAETLKEILARKAMSGGIGGQGASFDIPLDPLGGELIPSRDMQRDLNMLRGDG